MTCNMDLKKKKKKERRERKKRKELNFHHKTYVTKNSRHESSVMPREL